MPFGGPDNVFSLATLRISWKPWETRLLCQHGITTVFVARLWLGLRFALRNLEREGITTNN